MGGGGERENGWVRGGREIVGRCFSATFHNVKLLTLGHNLHVNYLARSFRRIKAIFYFTSYSTILSLHVVKIPEVSALLQQSHL